MDRPPGTVLGLMESPGTTAPGLMTNPPGLKRAPRGLRCWVVGILICRPPLPLVIGCSCSR